jgi:O-acetyl-ADP-ribose deacetylase (regulator of RNase III)
MVTAAFEGTRLHDATVRLTRDDITLLDVDAFVFYASHDLVLGTGYGTAISARGGPTIQKELQPLAPLETGQVVATGAGDLTAKHILHAVGPRFQEPELEEKLLRTMVNTLALAESLGVRRLAFPPMGAGFYGIPPELCARVMLESLERHLAGETRIEDVIVCVLDARQYQSFGAALDRVAGNPVR